MWQGILNKIFKVREKVAMNLNKGDEEKPFLDHLEDLRTMLVRMAVTLLVATLGTFGFYKDLFSVIMHPLVMSNMAQTQKEAETMLINTDPSGAFMTVVNISMIAGVILSFPLLFFFLLQFVLPGLKQNEKKLLFPAILVGAGLFLTGLLFSYYSVLPRALAFFNSFGNDLGVKQMWTLNQYVTFSTRFVLIFGVSFELPVVVMALVKLDFLSYKVMKGTRAHALIAIAIFSAIITPTQDVLTLLLLAGPLYVLYEICIWLAYFMEKKDREAYPEYYAELEKDEKAFEKDAPADDWENDYNPWGDSASEEDDEDYKRSRKMAEDNEAKSSGVVDGQPAAEAERSAEAASAPDDQTGAADPEDDSLKRNQD